MNSKVEMKLKKVYIVIGYLNDTTLEVIACKDKETADNYCLDFVDRDLTVETHVKPIISMKEYNKED